MAGIVTDNKTIYLRDVPRTDLRTTLKKMEVLVDPACGIVRSIIPNLLEQGDPLIYAFGAIGNLTNVSDAESQTNNAGGAALDRDRAIAATIGEAIERYCASYCEPDKLVFAAYQDIAIDAVHPAKFALFSDRQYATPGFPHKPFTETSPVSWTWGYSLQRKRPTLVPACLTYLPFRYAAGSKETPICNSTSTGLACGNTLEEAVLSAIGEVVERDALTCFWMNRLPLPHVEVDEASPIYDVYREKLALPGLRYWLLDATTDLGIPAFFTLLKGYSRTGSKTGMMVNVGSQANAATYQAALKSLVEAAHGRPYVRFILQKSPVWEYAPDFSTVRSFQDHAAFYTRAPQHHDAFDFITESSASIRLSDIKNMTTGTVLGDIEFYLDRLAQHDIDVIICDLTAPDIRQAGFHVVRAILPGLRLLHGDNTPFLGGERLYHVPKAMGYRDRPSKEEELNPYPHPLP